MVSGLSCDELRDVAGELASGILSGSSRAEALEHLEHCTGCRSSVEKLSEAADWVLLAAPEADPPMGFESRVLSPITEPSPAGPRANAATPHRSASPTRTIRWRRAVIGIAAVAAASVGGVVGVAALDAGAHGTSHEQVADPTSLRSASFVGADGRPVGQLQAYNGRPAWVFMNVDASGADGTVVCQLQMANGTTVPVGVFEVHDGVGEWAHTVGIDVGQLHGAKLVTASGSTLAAASFS